MPPEYPRLAPEVILGAAWALLGGGRRSFRQDALRLARDLAVVVSGAEHIPQSGPGVVVFNHYSRPGFQAWWIAIALAARVPVEMHWTMTAAWTEAGDLGSRVKAAASALLFPRLARVYGFTAMPPMPPRPHEAQERARAVRQVLAAVRKKPRLLVGLSPEGQDAPGGALMRPHPGAGRFLALLSGPGYPFYPVGVDETNAALRLHFGPPFRLELPPGTSPQQVDRLAADAAMQAIAALLPERLRGAYASKQSD